MARTERKEGGLSQEAKSQVPRGDKYILVNDDSVFKSSQGHIYKIQVYASHIPRQAGMLWAWLNLCSYITI